MSALDKLKNKISGGTINGNITASRDDVITFNYVRGVAGNKGPTGDIGVKGHRGDVGITSDYIHIHGKIRGTKEKIYNVIHNDRSKLATIEFIEKNKNDIQSMVMLYHLNDIKNDFSCHGYGTGGIRITSRNFANEFSWRVNDVYVSHSNMEQKANEFGIDLSDISIEDEIMLAAYFLD